MELKKKPLWEVYNKGPKVKITNVKLNCKERIATSEIRTVLNDKRKIELQRLSLPTYCICVV